MTGFAGDRTVRAFKREGGGAVVETRDLFPIVQRVAHFAFLGRSVRLQCSHTLTKLALVVILVACQAILTLKDVPGWGRRVNTTLALVTTVAENCRVSSCQWEIGFSMKRQGKRRRLESAGGVTILAAILVRRAPELPLVHVLVANHTIIAFEHKHGFGSVGNMAFCALHGGMFFQERELSSGMQGNRECRWLEPFDHVTRRALSLVRTQRKLPLVIVLLLVAVEAFRESHGRLEVARQVAELAGDGSVLSFQRVLRSRVIECSGDLRRLPILDGVT